MARFTTEEMREEFLVEKVFSPDDINLTYSYNDRMIIGGLMPVQQQLEIVLDTKLGVEYFLERREMGVINIGGNGRIVIDGQAYDVNTADGFYIGCQTRQVVFSSVDPNTPAKFYIASAPAHHKYPTKKISVTDVKPLELGDQNSANVRKIYQYVHPNNVEACQVQMGYTHLAPGSNWNTMPCHTHERRMECYMYCELDDEQRVFHIMGKPQETKHVVVANEQAVINPSWSVHCGVGTSNYSFIWAMCGENITYTDMDQIATKDLQ
jgi:4-deoxy-L-threo-5-hexosulose-uronate ketol-isomerase